MNELTFKEACRLVWNHYQDEEYRHKNLDRAYELIGELGYAPIDTTGIDEALKKLGN